MIRENEIPPGSFVIDVERNADQSARHVGSLRVRVPNPYALVFFFAYEA